MMKRKSEEPDTLSGVYDELLGDMNEALSWAKGEVTLRTTTRSAAELASATVTLEPDVAAVFDNATAVNEALRFIIKITKDNATAVSTK